MIQKRQKKQKDVNIEYNQEEGKKIVSKYIEKNEAI